jgi:hypothetical protein
VKWGEKIIATNFADDIQIITFGDDNFAIMTVANSHKARHMGVVRDFVVTGNTEDGVDGNVPHRVQWSGLNDETDLGEVNATTQADYQDLLGSGGWVQKVVGGEYGIVFQETSIWRMTYIGSPIVFQFDQILPGHGTPAPGSVAQYGDWIFYLSQQGFEMLINGVDSKPIGAQRIDRTFFADLDATNIHRMSSAIDPVNFRVYWAYPGAGNTGGMANRILVYDWSADRWTYSEQDTQHLFVASLGGYTLDGLDAITTDLDALPASLDSREWIADTPTMGKFDADNKLAFYTGSAMTAEIQTPELQLFPERRSMLRTVRPLVDGGTTTVQVGSRNLQSEAVSTTPAKSLNSSGIANIRKNARYHRFRLNISGDWINATGVEPEMGKVGVR